MNYDTTVVGKPYARMPVVEISTPAPGLGIPSVKVSQELGIKLWDGSYAVLPDTLPQFRVEFDLAQHGNDPIPLVNPEDGSPFVVNGQAQYTTLNQTMLCILAVLRAEQEKVNG